MTLTPVDQSEADAATVNARGGRAAVTGRTQPDPAHTGPVQRASFPELLGRLINDVSDLVDRQIELAKVEFAETREAARGALVRGAIGAGVMLAAALLLLIWAWTGVIWFFNWLGGFISLGPVTLTWLGWLVGVLVPAVAAFIAYRWFIRSGLAQAMQLWPPLERTRATLREDLEWVRQQRTRRLT
jgi:hypothetical protein